MKGVILAGGTGTRLYPLTKLMNKHLLPIGKHPMIHYAIDKLKEAEITDILLITGKQSAGLYTDYLGSGKDWGVSLNFKIQDEAGGIAQALSLAESYISREEKFVMILGDNLFEDNLKPYVERFKQQPNGAMVLLKKVPDPKRYGVPLIHGGKIVKIDEKPEKPLSNFCVTGIYMYDGGVFDVIRTVQPSQRGELEITDVNNAYAVNDLLSFSVLEGWWSDAGTFESLHEAQNVLSRGRERG
ncbi:sugar phosphate nucleotidyltransferase [Ferviditalea candida]|uniref:Glucose-1-phosphate thymidylyltransferase n=1 Tax=Ferviditalea candida TaxID=3108399 RepID=A0ABU5ZD59_9BACL|nr:sugar phosphate nucleotidyltransferase [Paenibacillaceae bacterium T2]